MATAVPAATTGDVAVDPGATGDVDGVGPTGSTAPHPLLRGVLLVAVLGYLVGGRTFAYLGIPAVNLFVGEVLLVLCLIARPTRRRFEQAWHELVAPGRWHLLSVAIAAMLLAGVFAALRGFEVGNRQLDALKNLPFNYYALFLVVGLWWGLTDPAAMRTVTLWLARVNAVYGTAYVLVLSRLDLTLPGQDAVPLFGNGNSAGLALLGLIAYHRHRRETPVLMVMCAFVLLGIQQRSEWLGFTLGLLALCLLTRQMKSFFQAGGAVLGLLTLVSVLGLTIPGAEHRGGEISLEGVFGRSLAAVAPAVAEEYVDIDTDTYADNASWRTTWWSAIWRESTDDAPTAVLGHGYGYELHELGYNVPADTRTPHNAFFYALGYTGWLGVSVTALLWGCLGHLLWQVFRRTGDGFGIVLGVFVLGLGMFGNWFETPFGALPTYLLIGVALARLTRPAQDPDPTTAAAARRTGRASTKPSGRGSTESAQPPRVTAA